MTREHTGTSSQKYPDRCYRSSSALAGGVLLLALSGWLGIDALVRGEGRTPWAASAGLLFFVPLVVAFTLRPAVYAGDERMRVRNPFRTITIPWGAVESLRAAYSAEVVADGKKYQMWALPVSMRARKTAVRRDARARSGKPAAPRAGLLGMNAQADDSGAEPRQAAADQAIAELRELAERHTADPPGGPGTTETPAASEGSAPAVSVHWAYAIMAPALAGLLALLALYLTR